MYPLVTIGLCTKNNRKTVDETLDSIIRLDYPKDRLEIIVVDGCSNDGTLERVNEFLKCSKIRSMILSDSGLGIGYARQLVVENASSEFIAFVDADQALHPMWLKEALNEIINDEKIAAVSGVNMLTPGSTVASVLENYKKFVQDHNLPEKSNINVLNFAIGGTLIRKSAIENAEGFDPVFALASEDTDIAFRLVKKGYRLIKLRSAIFRHYIRRTWRDLFKQYRNWAVFTSYVRKKYHLNQNRKKILLNIFISFFVGLRDIFKVLTLTKDIRCILLPIEYVYTSLSYNLHLALH